MPELHRNWDKLPGDYLEHGFLAGGIGVNHPARKKIAELLSCRESQTLLDVGCGPGIGIDSLEQERIGIDYTGLDVTKKIIRLAKKKHPGKKFVQGDAELLPFKGKSFDVVLIRHLLEHLPGYEKALREAARVSRKLFIVDFFFEPREGKDVIGSRNWLGTRFWQNHYNKEKLAKFVEESTGKPPEFFHGLGRGLNAIDVAGKETWKNFNLMTVDCLMVVKLD